MKFLRKMSFVLAVCILMTGIFVCSGVADEETDLLFFVPSITNMLDYSVEYLVSTTSNRALLWMAIALDIQQEYNITVNAITNMKLAYDESTGMVSWFGKSTSNGTEWISVIYIPENLSSAGFGVATFAQFSNSVMQQDFEEIEDNPNFTIWDLNSMDVAMAAMQLMILYG